MGRYNPNIPRILGQEWVPIRDEDITFSPAVNIVERGQGFTLTASTLIQNAHFYVHDPAPGPGFAQTMITSIYARGTENQTGPIKTVIIPCNNGGITGDVFSPVINGSSFSDALLSPSDNFNISVATNTGTAQVIGMFFATNQYSAQLSGKRILAVNFLYTASGGGQEGSLTRVGSDSQLLVFDNLTGQTPVNTRDISRIRLGDINYFWDPTQDVTTSFNALPWKYPDLQRLEASATNRLHIEIDVPFLVSGTSTNTWQLNYAALEIIYCEEKRVAIGGRIFKGSLPSRLTLGMNSMNMYSNQGYVINPTLGAGDYTVVLSSGDPGDLSQGEVANSTYPILNGLREVYAIYPHPGVQVDIPFPIDESVGKTFTTQSVHVVPQLTLHTSGGPLTEVQVYGRQARAEVYGSITATQEIYDSGLTAALYPQVRFYARRFGETTVPLKLASTTTPATNVSITPEDFDVLDEVLDGWKEVTLTFPTPPTLGAGTNPQYNWSATGETSGNRWEVLGAIAPAVSGVPANLLTLAPPPNQLGTATYGAPVSGSPINLGWVPGYAPAVSATTDDPSSDAFLIFSQDMPTITGMSITVLSQAVTGIGQNCGIDPVFIPSQIQYNYITWPPQQGFTVNDNFSRVSASGWGTATSGQTWTLDGGVATDYTVNGSSGVITLSASGSSRHTSVLTNTFLDIDGYGQISMTTTPTVAMTWGSLTWHKESAVNEMYQAEIDWMPDGSVALALRKWVGGVDTVLATITIGYGYVLGTKYNLRIQQRGFSISARAWLDGSEEPTYWQLNVADSDLDIAAGVGTRSRIDAGGGTPQVVLYDNILFSDPIFGAFELQRMDTVEPTWQTIMLATSPALTGFKDYEARIGILSSYRIRMLNLYNFAGPWSSTVTSTIPAPGVTGSQIVADSHILTFTTNQVQSGFYNLAYSMAWEDTPITEGFDFPEAGFVTLQTMYNKDFYTAFRPLERGGEEFTRTLLVQAAAISPETLADFTGLRDMAWFNVNYICVRDEDGNRWFATVIVPDGRVRRDRRLYLATVKVIEVTDTPTPVNP